MITLLFLSLVANASPVQPIRRTERHQNKLTLLHTNGIIPSLIIDIHAHFDQFNDGGFDCSESEIYENHCFGGVARLKTKIDEIRSKNKNVLLLDAGDQFQGTLFFNIFGGYLSSIIMNDFKYDAMCIGNHEFDRGVPYLADFFRNLSFPVIASNIDFSTAPILKEAGVKPFVVFRKYNLGVIGYITNTTSMIAPGAQGINFMNPASRVQQYVDYLNSKGIHRIICVSHNGYRDDVYLAENTRGISAIIGGHSHSLLLKDSEDAEGPYPTDVKNLEGKSTYVLQAHRYGDYLGYVDMEWNDQNELINFNGDPIKLDQAIKQNGIVQKQVDSWRLAFKEIASKVVTIASSTFRTYNCYKHECPMGDLVADAFLYNTSVHNPDLALINAGGIRSSFLKGPITLGTLMNVLPFQNQLVVLNYTGQEILDILERAFTNKHKITGNPVITMPQWSSTLQVYYNPNGPNWNKVLNVSISGSPLDLDRTYRLVTNDYLMTGGDGILDKYTKDPIFGEDATDSVRYYMEEYEVLTPNASQSRLIAVDTSS
jgi:5'-nucleotidase